MKSRKRKSKMSILAVLVFLSFFIAVFFVIVILGRKNIDSIYKSDSYNSTERKAVDFESTYLDLNSIQNSIKEPIDVNDIGIFNANDLDYKKRYAYNNLEFFYQYDEYNKVVRKAHQRNSDTWLTSDDGSFFSSLMNDICIISDSEKTKHNATRFLYFDYEDKNARYYERIHKLINDIDIDEFRNYNKFTLYIKNVSGVSTDDLIIAYNMLLSYFKKNDMEANIYICLDGSAHNIDSIKSIFEGSFIDLSGLSSLSIASSSHIEDIFMDLYIPYIGFYTKFIEIREREFVSAKHITADDIEDNEDNNEKEIFMTFDDGTAEYTLDLLDILEKYNIKATFFVTYVRPTTIHTLRDIKSRGHVVAAHTYSHKYSIYKSKETYFDDLYKIECVIRHYNGEFSKLIRFPGGSANHSSFDYNKGIMKELVVDVEDMGYVYYDWNVSSGDGGAISSEVTLMNSINGISKPGNKFVILFHETRKTTIDIVENFIQYALNIGCKFSTLKENSMICHQHISE